MSDGDIHSPEEAFEDHFRGSRQEIVRRLSVYLPLLEEAGVRSLPGPILDLGFGRGEWLDLLADHGHVAVGSDLSEAVVARGLEAGLDVAQAEALRDLRERPDASLAAVTAFHVIEHLDPAALGELLSEIHRVLAPGGVVVLETPNPENVTVASASFYIDADHVRPVPPQLLEFHARRAGFSLPWIARVNRAVLGAPLPEVAGDVPGAHEVNAVVYAVNGLLFAAPDYALVAQKAGGAGSPLDAAVYERLFGPQPQDLQTYRRLAAEEAARRLQVDKLEAEERAAELAREAAEAEELAAEAERLATEAERLATEAAERLAAVEELATAADERARGAERQVHQAWEDLAVVSSSLSWRVTAPLRAGGGFVRRLSPGRAAGRGRPPKTYAKLAVGYPARWALSHPRLGPVLDKGLARLPAVDQKVRIAIHETRAERIGAPAVAAVLDEADLRGLSESARAVVADLERALSGGAR